MLKNEPYSEQKQQKISFSHAHKTHSLTHTYTRTSKTYEELCTAGYTYNCVPVCKRRENESLHHTHTHTHLDHAASNSKTFVVYSCRCRRTHIFYVDPCLVCFLHNLFAFLFAFFFFFFIIFLLIITIICRFSFHFTIIGVNPLVCE